MIVSAWDCGSLTAAVPGRRHRATGNNVPMGDIQTVVIEALAAGRQEISGHGISAGSCGKYSVRLYCPDRFAVLRDRPAMTPDRIVLRGVGGNPCQFFTTRD